MKNKTKLRIFWTVLIIMLSGMLIIFNSKTFRPKTVIPKSAIERAEFPLQRVTTDIRLDKLAELFNSANPVELECDIPLTRIGAVNIKPAKGIGEDRFNEVVNRDGYADKLCTLYESEGFEFKNDKLSLKIYVDNDNHVKYVRFPTWILYGLLEKK